MAQRLSGGPWRRVSMPRCRVEALPGRGEQEVSLTALEEGRRGEDGASHCRARAAPLGAEEGHALALLGPPLWGCGSGSEGHAEPF